MFMFQGLRDFKPMIFHKLFKPRGVGAGILVRGHMGPAYIKSIADK